MASTLDVSTATAILKEYYSGQRVADMTYKDAPFYAMLKKVKDFEGKVYPLPTRVNNPQGRSNTFSNAQSQKHASDYVEFLLTRTKDYSLASIATEMLLASQSDAGAFIRAATAEIDGTVKTLARSLQTALFSDGSGARGSAAASPTSANPSVITLTSADDIVKFEVGMTIQARSGATTRLFATGVSTALITGIDRDSGTITVAVDNSGNTDTIVANDTFNIVGDYGLQLSGLASWVPATAPSSAAFFGVDRTIDVTRLAGMRYDATTSPIDEALVSASRRLAREGHHPDTCILNFEKHAQLEKTLNSRVRYTDVEVGSVGFRAIEISGPSKTIKVLADKDCPANRGYMVTMENWALYSLGEPVRILDQDGTNILREYNADSLEVRVASYSQLGCAVPASNLVLKF